MNIVAGKRYVTSCGKITSSLSSDSFDGFYGTIDGVFYSWNKTGLCSEASHYHLIEKFETSPVGPSAPKTDKSNTGLVLIPFYSLFRLGAIFIEGLRYGKDNWKKGVNDKDYQEERLEHALVHFIKWKEGDRSEDHLAKVAWFCFTQMELERLETLNQSVSNVQTELVSNE